MYFHLFIFTASECFISSIMGKCLLVFTTHHEEKLFRVVFFLVLESRGPFHPT